MSYASFAYFVSDFEYLYLKGVNEKKYSSYS